MTDPLLRLETVANLLKLLERLFSRFSKRILKLLENQTDFDSAIRRFDPSHPSHLILLGNRTSFRRLSKRFSAAPIELLYPLFLHLRALRYGAQNNWYRSITCSS
jgi:hypothetical protein